MPSAPRQVPRGHCAARIFAASRRAGQRSAARAAISGRASEADPGRLGDDPAVYVIRACLVHDDQCALRLRAPGGRHDQARLPVVPGGRTGTWQGGGTILAIQGGPGYATTDYAPSYRATFLPLLKTRNLLLVNLRGTGNSSSFTCKALQNWTLADGIAAYTTDTGKCGWQLNHSRKLRGSSRYVQGSDLYTTAIAARDVALLLGRLKTGKVDLYGDSYGTFFSQVFTSRYASLLRSVTLDAAYPVSQTDPWYPDTILTARHAFNLACRRSVACSARRARFVLGTHRQVRQLPARAPGERQDARPLRRRAHRDGRG